MLFADATDRERCVIPTGWTCLFRMSRQRRQPRDAPQHSATFATCLPWSLRHYDTRSGVYVRSSGWALV